MSTTTSGDLARAWTERVRAGTFSPAVAGTREVRVFGQAGDAPVVFPQLRALQPGETPELVIELLEPDERWALAHAERVVITHQQAGRLTAEVQRGRVDGEVIPAQRIDPLKGTDILILNQITGG
ncbi:MAG TPA: hypothetical protein PKD53_29370, partial [Chloroflexaceae bacterium]|nr:hypothetical protein [Chloroflexaceae bacterium]